MKVERAPTPVRPKKVILLVNPKEDSISTLRLVLKCNILFRPLWAPDLAGALAELDRNFVDLIVVTWRDVNKASDLLIEIKKSYPHVRSILIHGTAKIDPDRIYPCDSLLDKYVSRAELIQRITLMSQRKRGPKRGYCDAKPEPVAELAIA